MDITLSHCRNIWIDTLYYNGFDISGPILDYIIALQIIIWTDMTTHSIYLDGNKALIGRYRLNSLKTTHVHSYLLKANLDDIGQYGL